MLLTSLRAAGVNVEEQPQIILPHGTPAIGDDLLSISDKRQIINLRADPKVILSKYDLSLCKYSMNFSLWHQKLISLYGLWGMIGC